jgi:hypothetical protein
MARVDKDGNWINRNGKPVSPEHINKVVKKRDQVVSKIMAKALRLEGNIKKAKMDILKEVDRYLQALAKASEADMSIKDSKGNITLTDYSGLNQIEVSINDLVEFDERILVAKDLIDKCLNKWADGANENIRSIISEAFNTDKQGKINKFMIIRLTKIEIKDPDWKKAIGLIIDSMNVRGTRQYVNLRTRESSDDRYRTINLNFSSI